MVDGDDTYPAEHARQMCDLVLEQQADMVIGDRLSATYFTENSRAFHNMGNRLVRKLINSLFGSHIHDIMTGYRAFSRLFVKSFPVLSKGFEIETEMTIHALDKNFLLMEVPVDYRDRPAGSVSKLNTVSDGFRVLGTIFTLMRDYRPLTFFNTLGGIFTAVWVALFLPIFLEFCKTGLVPRFPTMMLVIGLMVISILLFITGTILSVINKKHRQLFELYLLSLEQKK